MYMVVTFMAGDIKWLVLPAKLNMITGRAAYDTTSHTVPTRMDKIYDISSYTIICVYYDHFGTTCMINSCKPAS